MASNLICNLGFPTILYHGEDGFPRLTTHHGLTCRAYPVPLPPGINNPINICSCSHGFILLYDPISNIYYIGNPLYPDSYIPLPQTPRQHDPQHTHVVLVAEILEPPRYHIVCAVEDSVRTSYTFDRYSSSIGRWLSYSGNDIGAHIIPNTGISCNAFAHWLTESPQSLFRFNIHSPLSSNRVSLPDDVISSVPEKRIQLGRIGNTVALLSVSVEGSPNFVVKLCLLPEGNPPMWDIFPSELPIPTRSWPIPRPIRFHSHDVEVFFWANGQLMLLRTTLNTGQTGLLDMLNEEGVRVADGIAFVFSTHRPQDFPVTFQQNDRDNDECNDSVGDNFSINS